MQYCGYKLIKFTKLHLDYQLYYNYIYCSTDLAAANCVNF